MGFELDIFDDHQLEPDYLDWLVDSQSINAQMHFEKLWLYYANPMVEITAGGATDRKVNESGRCYVQAQEYGLPSRITGLIHSGNASLFGARCLQDVQRKEVVIENDLAWRVNATVDFLFGKPISFVSKSPDGQKRAEIEVLIKAVFAANGGIGFLQDMAVLGSVYGFVDCFVRPGDEIIEHITSSSSQTLKYDDVLKLAQTIDLELIEAPRALPVLEENDYKQIRYYVQHFVQKKNSLSRKNSFLARILSLGPRSGGKRSADSRQVVAVTEITSANAWQRYEDKQLVAQDELPWGFLPVVHIQNIAQPYYYEGHSDIEPLIPLQDELNTRLSDRANRITFQSFKLYLGKGIEGFEDKPI